MSAWWQAIGPLGHAMVYAAAFFSVLFVWQILSVLLGHASGDAPDGDHDFGAGDGHDAHDAPTDAHGHAHAHGDTAETVEAFRLLSIRSIVTFFLLFTWGAALYLGEGKSPGAALGLAAVWGLAGMFAIALLLHWLPRMADAGAKDIASSVGQQGTVYLDIPANGAGQVRAMVSGVLSHIEARGVNGVAIKAPARIRIVRQLDAKLVEVEPLTEGSAS